MIKLIIIFFLILLILFLDTNELYNNYQELSNNETDYGTVVPYNKNHKYEGIKMEIHPAQMDGILTFMKSRFPQYTNVASIDQNLVNNSDYFYTQTKNWLLNLINLGSCEMSEHDIYEIQSPEQQSDIDKNRTFLKIQNMNDFTIIHDKLETQKTSADTNFIRFEMKLVVYREPADIAFSIDAHMVINKISNTYYINRLELLGIIFEDKIKIVRDGLRNTVSDCSLRNSYECNTLASNTAEYQRIQRETIRNNTLREKQLNEDALYRCFGKNAQNKFECESFELLAEEDTGLYRKVPPGIWAKRRCTNNEECPYYRANQNYPNNRGGCVNGACEMPLNVANITPTIPDPRTNPFCHNCERNSNCSGTECLQCCNSQRSNRNMASPDYAFTNDTQERSRYANTLRRRNLSPFKLTL